MKRHDPPFALLAAALLSACGSGGGTDGGNPPGGDGNDTFAAAQIVAIGSPSTGSISSATDQDWFMFTTTGAGDVTVALTGLSADADLALYDSSQVQLSASSNTGTVSETVTWTAGAADTFRVVVLPGATAANYTLAVTFTPAAGGDGNDTFLTAQAVAIGSTTAGAIASISDPDWYKFTTTGAGTVTVTLGALTADANLALYDAAETWLTGSSNLGTASDTVSHVAAAAGTFYVQVVPQGGAATYTLTVAFTPAVVSDGNDTFATAQAVAINTTISGTIASITDPDWYRVTTPGAGTITVTLSGLSSDADLELYGTSAGLLIVGSYFAGTQVDTVSYTYTAAITYRVLVKPGGSSTPYSLAVAFTP